MFTFLLLLAPLLDLEHKAPIFYSSHQTLMDCVIAENKAAFENAELLRDPGNEAMGLRFVCFELRGSV